LLRNAFFSAIPWQNRMTPVGATPSFLMEPIMPLRTSYFLVIY